MRITPGLRDSTPSFLELRRNWKSTGPTLAKPIICSVLPGQHKRLKFKTPPGQAAHRPSKIDSDNAESPAGDTSDDAPLQSRPIGPSTSATPVAVDNGASPIGSRKRKTKKGHK